MFLGITKKENKVSLEEMSNESLMGQNPFSARREKLLDPFPVKSCQY